MAEAQQEIQVTEAEPTQSSHHWSVVALVGALTLTLVLGFGAGVAFDRLVLLKDELCPFVPDDAMPEFQLLAQAWRTIDLRYVEQEALDAREMIYGAIEGVVGTLDDPGHTRFLTPEELRRHHQQSQGEFEGIGAYVTEHEGAFILTPMEDSPAEEAGLEAGDRLLEIDGKTVAGLTLGDVVAQVSGPAGTEVALTVEDAETGERRTVTVTRAAIALDLVTWEPLPGTSAAHVRIAAFSEGATEDLEGILAEIQAADGIDSAVLDLRSNPGGLLWEAVDTTSQFVEDGVVLERENALDDVTEVNVRDNTDATDLPLVVLVNGSTASAAEIVAGALQDHERAPLVGTSTAGAGTVLNEFTLSDGSALLLAVEEWRTPTGREIWRQGLAPDVIVELPPEVPLVTPDELSTMTAADLAATQDRQLLRALEILAADFAN